jgi:hypothetical protein
VFGFGRYFLALEIALAALALLDFVRLLAHKFASLLRQPDSLV